MAAVNDFICNTSGSLHGEDISDELHESPPHYYRWTTAPKCPVLTLSARHTRFQNNLIYCCYPFSWKDTHSPSKGVGSWLNLARHKVWGIFWPFSKRYVCATWWGGWTLNLQIEICRRDQGLRKTSCAWKKLLISVCSWWYSPCIDNSHP